MIRRTLVQIGVALVAATQVIFGPSFSSPMEPNVAFAQATVTVGEPVAVVSNSYPGGGGFAYDAVVVFWVTNSSPTQAAVNVPFRVTIDAAGSTVYQSDGRDTVTIYPNETRLVAFRASDGPPIDVVPETASVQVYPSSSMMRNAPASTQSSWVMNSYRVRCQGQSIECEVVGDLAWTGAGTRRPVSVAAVVYAGGDDGPIVGGGMSGINPGVMDSGQVAPFRVSLRGFDQPTPARAPVLPDGQFSVKIYVEAAP